VLDVTRHHLLRHGAEHEEAAVCWAGTMVGEVALVTTVLRVRETGSLKPILLATG
jgi:hypothetical protein